MDPDILFRRTDNFTTHLLEHFEQFRSDGEMVDFQIKVEHEVLQCHRVVLAASSPVLHRMIMTSMKEGNSKEVDLDGVQAHIMKLIVQYMYTGEARVKQSELVDIVRACDYLQVLDFKEQCLDHVPKVLNPSNAVMWYQLADPLNLEDIKQRVFALFRDIISDEYFLSLEGNEFKSMLEEAKRRDVAVDDLLSGAMTWVNYDPDSRMHNMEELMVVIEVEKSSSGAIRNTLSRYKHVVDRNTVFYKVLVQSLVQLNCPRDQVSDSRRQLQEEHQAGKDTLRMSPMDFTHYIQKATVRDLAPDLLLSRILQWIEHDTNNRLKFMAVLLGSIRLQSCTWTMLRVILVKYKHLLDINGVFYKLFTEKLPGQTCPLSLLVLGTLQKKYRLWRLTRSKKPAEVSRVPAEIVSAGHSMCVYRDVGLILTGGIHGRGKICAVYSVLTKQWMRHMNMQEDRFRHASVCLSEMLYVIGGDLGKQGWSVSMQCHSMDGTCWMEATALPTALEFPKVVGHGTSIYAMGNNHQALLIYDTTYQRWSQKEIPIDPGYGFSMAASGDRVFFAGGTKKVCYAYSVVTGNWLKLDVPGKRHIGGMMTYHENKLILLGGDGPGEGLEEYDIEQGTWDVSHYTLPDSSVLLEQACEVQLP